MLAHVGSCWPPFFWWLLGIPEFVMGLKIDCLQQQSHNRAPWTILAWQVTKHTWIFGFQFSKLRMNSEKWLVLVSHVVSTDHIRDEMFSQWFPCIYGIDGWTNPARYHEVPAMLWRPCLRNGSFFFGSSHLATSGHLVCSWFWAGEWQAFRYPLVHEHNDWTSLFYG